MEESVKKRSARGEQDGHEQSPEGFPYGGGRDRRFRGLARKQKERMGTKKERKETKGKRN